MESKMSRLSYLRARDPTIINWNASDLPRKALFEESDLCTNTCEPEERIEVFLRLKKNSNICPYYDISPSSIQCKCPNKLEKYLFSYVFNFETRQSEIFNHITKPKLFEFIQGQNFTLITYGCTGSGKTYTLIGTEREPGIIPRTLLYLFRSLKNVSQFPKFKPLPDGLTQSLSDSEIKMEELKYTNIVQNVNILKDRHAQREIFTRMEQRLSSAPWALINNLDEVTTAVWISFVEIYNENIYDLLVNDKSLKRTNLKLGFANNRTYVKDLTSINVKSATEAFELLQYGLGYLKYAATDMNDHSSRSHSIFTIKLVQVGREEDSIPIVSYYNFCDLAGSERLNKTNNSGIRLRESNNINTSLLTLQKCIRMVRNSQRNVDVKRHIPFRESKLTRILEKALSGCEKISMIVNLNPSPDMFDQSQTVLKFSAIAQNIVVSSSNLTNLQKVDKALEQHNKKERIHHLQDILNEKRVLAEKIRQERRIAENAIRHETYMRCQKMLEELEEDWQSEIDELRQNNLNLRRKLYNLKTMHDKKVEIRNKLKKLVEQQEAKEMIITIEDDESDND